jgi:Sensors of blue-light using FAD
MAMKLNQRESGMLIRLIYVSTEVGPQTGTMTHSILKTAQAWNQANKITGVLCQGQGVFLQVLEGERAMVTKLYARIYADQRHTNVELIHCESIAQRRYEKWSMAQVNLSDIDPKTKIEWSAFEPYSATGLLVMARIDELLASGTAIQSPDSPAKQ